MTQFILHRIVLLLPTEELSKLPEPLIKDAGDVYNGFQQLYNDCQNRTEPL